MLTIKKCIALVIALAAAVITIAAQSTPENGIVKSDGGLDGKKAAATQQYQSNPADAVPSAIEPKAAQTTPQTDPADENIEIQRKLARFTRLLVIVGFLQFAVLAGTVWAIWRQTNFFRNSERAWLLVETAKTRAVDGKPAVYPVVENRGKTIARIRRFSLGGCAFQRGNSLPNLPTYQVCGEYNLVLCPNQPFQPLCIPDEGQSNSVRAGVVEFYIFGRVEYIDLGGNKRATAFCLTYDIDAHGFVPCLGAPSAYNKAT